jgi:hypothetical protein
VNFNAISVLKIIACNIPYPYSPSVTAFRLLDSTIINLLDIIQRSVFFFVIKNVSETGFCLRPRVKSYSVGPKRQSESLSPETESSLRNVVFNKETGQ